MPASPNNEPASRARIPCLEPTHIVPRQARRHAHRLGRARSTDCRLGVELRNRQAGDAAPRQSRRGHRALGLIKPHRADAGVPGRAIDLCGGLGLKTLARIRSKPKP